MKKLLVFVLTLSLVLGMFAGCGKADNKPTDKAEQEPAVADKAEATTDDSAEKTGDNPLHVGFSLSTLQFPFYVRMKEGFEGACNAKGWTYTITDANFDAETQLNNCQDLLLQDIDVLVISSWYPDALTDIYEQAEEQEVPIFVVDMARIADDVNYVSKMGTDNYDSGYMGGVWAAQYFINEMGKEEINLVTISPADQVPLDRIEGFKQGLEDGGAKMNLLQSFLGSTTREDHMTAAEDALTTYDNIDLIYGLDAQAGLASYDACQAANRTDIKVLGMDGEEEEIKLIEAGDEMYIGTITQFPDQMSVATVENIDRYVNHGEEIDKVISFPSGITWAEGVIMQDEVLAAIA